ncbi:WecB/TagA/CpsF family glycosyltransferase [Zobellia sp. B3R18]|uniref:WecB/TagA/CpsF family glycosyltransferase n=1 Tax=Zobellia sp. B3R18 TaxID=2841568 RepID=UPI001C07DCCB|nr:WecB/TagA/CpsF family glycosyltransferase [Zobellia sp. B3R18]MBU2974891.1 WecB/TagA/CpsF family glycosyltransferase [Zobellia sp. B3R18]
MKQLFLYGCPCFEVTSKEVAENFLLTKINEGKGGYTAAINALKLVSYNEDPATKDVIDKAILQTPDGFGAQLAFRLQHKSKVIKLDLPGLAMELCQKNNLRLYFLGTTEENNAAAVKEAQRIYPGINIVGNMSGFFDGQGQVEKELERTNPHIVMISMGSPRQEILSANLHKKFPGIIFVGSGGRMDILAGKLKRAPVWMQNNGLEWLYRFLQEPKRMFKGQIVGGIKFFKLIFWR